MGRSSAAPTGPGTRLGRVTLVRAIGAGASGSIYEAVDDDGRRVAIKLLKVDLQSAAGPELVARFVREAKTAACVQHRNAVSVLDVDTDPETGCPFLTMELLEGEDLQSVLDRETVLPPTIAARIIRQACHGVAAAHALGMVHRDIKPSNLFLHRSEGGEIVTKVCDFGMAKWIAGGDSLTQSGAVLGTPLYTSPEQLSDAKHVDLRTDVWSLGMTLYRTLSGRDAFADIKSYAELLVAIRSSPVPLLQSVAPWVEPGLATIVHGALVRDIPSRCPSAEALAAALEPFCGDGEHISDSMLKRAPDAMLSSREPRIQHPNSWAEASPSQPRTIESATPDPRVGSTVAGRWTLRRVLGKGGMGVVYEAEDAAGDRCALKLLIARADASDVESTRRFVREGRALMAIQNPHVVRLIDVDTDDQGQVPFIAMEMLSGSDLGTFLRTRGPLPPAVAARTFLQLCQGLAAAHSMGVVHRDIKPGNIFLHELPDGRVVPKVCDFGVAKRTAGLIGDDSTTDLTRTGGFLGSPKYMSPEQARNAKTVDQRADVWSLGVTMWETLSGARAWEECTTVGEVILAICTQRLRPLQQVAPWIDDELAAVVHKALAQEPKDRYPTAAEFAAALASAAAPVPELTTSVLHPIDDEIRSLAPVRVAAGDIRNATSTMGHASTIGASPTRADSHKRLAAIAIAVVALLAVLLWLARRSDTPAAEPTLAATGSSTARAGELEAPALAPQPAPTPSASSAELPVEPPVPELPAVAGRRQPLRADTVESAEPRPDPSSAATKDNTPATSPSAAPPITASPPAPEPSMPAPKEEW